MPRIDIPAAGGGGSGANLPVFNIADHGAVTGSGSSQWAANVAALQACVDAAVAVGGGTVWVPGNTYEITQSVSAPTACWTVVGNGITLAGVRDRSWIKMAAQADDDAVALVQLDGNSDIHISNLGFDGNWGNYVTYVAVASSRAVISGTLSVVDTTGFASSGSFVAVTSAGGETITYTGKTSTTFTGCSTSTGYVKVGSAVMVADSNAGQNHATQVDPKSHALMLRGVSNVTVEGCQFKQVYGDFIWVGASTTQTSYAKNVLVRDCYGKVAARDGLSTAQMAETLTMDHVRFEHVFAQAFDSEPIDTFVRDVHITNCYLDGWANPGNPARSSNAPVSIVGGGTYDGTATDMRFVRIEDSIINGSTIIHGAQDVRLRGNRHVGDFGGNSLPLIYMTQQCDNVEIDDCYFYDRTSAINGVAASTIYLSAAASGGTRVAAPANVKITDCQIQSRGGRSGISVIGTGGGDVFINSTHSAVADLSGTSTSIDASTTVAVASNNQSLATLTAKVGASSDGAALPVATINTHATFNTTGFPTSGSLKVTSNAGVQIVAYTGKTGTSFTGCSGGTGTISTGGLINNYIVLTVASTSAFPGHGTAIVATTAGKNRHFNYTGKTTSPDTLLDVTDCTGTVATGGAVTASVLTDNTKAWTTDQWAGWHVITNGVRGVIAWNTATQLSLFPPLSDNVFYPTTGWLGPSNGRGVPSPTTGTYVITVPRGIVTLDGNEIDCSDDGNGHGTGGIILSATRSGMRVRVHDNTLKNVDGDAIFVEAFDSARAYKHLEITDNHAYDHQSTPTTDSVVAFSSPFFDKLILRNNTPGIGVTATVTGLTSGAWLLSGGKTEIWAGYGSPENVVTAPIGSNYHRADGSVGTTLYVKESGTSSSGWVAYGGSGAASIPSWASQLGFVAGTQDPAVCSSNISLANQNLNLFKMRCWGSSFSNVMLQVGTALAGGSSPHVYLSVFRSDGTQSAQMAGCTVDALSTFQVAGVTSIALANAVPVTPGDDVYFAILVTGMASGTLPTLRANASGPINGTFSAAQGRRAAAIPAQTSIPASFALTAMTSASGQMPFLGVY